MCSFKSLVILLMLIAVSVGQRHNYMPCKPLPGDKLLQRVSCAKKFKALGYVSSTQHIYVGDHIIACVYALDQWGDDTGGYASIVSGGMGYTYVGVDIKSRFNRGFSFVIEVYGHKPVTCKYLRKCCVYFRTCTYTHTHTHIS